MGNSRPKKGSTIILEGVADQETWIWHAFFGMHGSLNDINVVNWSPLINKIANGNLPPVQFVANGRTYNYGYYLADGIYPKWQTFVKPLKNQKVRKILISTMLRRRLEKMWRELLRFCKPNFLL
ncbi:hypothetical protein VPH35_099819 [Triticum aestivum]